MRWQNRDLPICALVTSTRISAAGKCREGSYESRSILNVSLHKRADDEHCIEAARIPLDVPSLLRVGECNGANPEFAYTDFSTFSFIRIRARN